jgi:hypothetical protein
MTGRPFIRHCAQLALMLCALALGSTLAACSDAHATAPTSPYTRHDDVTYLVGGAQIDGTSTLDKVRVAPSASSGAPVVSTGAHVNVAAATFTDTSTANSGTATQHAFNAFQQPTLAASHTSVTTTDAATLYVANAPAAGTNETITSPWALWVDAGNVRLDGGVKFNSTSTWSSIAISGSATGTATVTAGSNCVCSLSAVSSTATLKTCAVSSTTLTATLTASDTATVRFICGL